MISFQRKFLVYFCLQICRSWSPPSPEIPPGLQTKATFHNFYVVMLPNYWLDSDFSLVKLLPITNDYEISSYHSPLVYHLLVASKSSEFEFSSIKKTVGAFFFYTSFSNGMIL